MALTTKASSEPGTDGSMAMKAAVLVAPGRFEMTEMELPEPGEGQVRVRLRGCGVCASNIPPFEGREWFDYPFEPGSPGHEGWGVVDAVGDEVIGIKPGDPVAVLSYHAYATHDIADARQVVRLPPQLADKPFPGEPLGCAMNIFRRADIAPGQTVAIVGVGFLGALLVGLAKDAGARVIAVSRRPSSLEMAEQFGAEHCVQMDDHERIIGQVMKLTDDDGCDRVIECTGKEWPLNLSGELTRVRGRLVIAGFHQDGMRKVNVQLWNWRGLDVINAHERDPAMYVKGIQEAVEAVMAERINPEPLYTHEFGLDESAEALKIAIERPEGFMKALIRC